jgi:hypothetical protein
LTFCVTFFMPLFVETKSGLHPILISLFHIVHGLVRILFPLHWLMICCYPDDLGSLIREEGPPKIVRRDWDSYCRLARFFNFFSTLGFVMDDKDFNFVMLRIPLVNMFFGLIHWAIVIIGIIPALLFTMVAETLSYSWLEWIWFHMLQGSLGLTCIGIYFYDCFGRNHHHKWIQCRFRKTFIAQLYPLNENSNNPPRVAATDLKDEEWRQMFRSTSYFFRTCRDYVNFMKKMGHELNPNRMAWLFEEDGQMNIADKCEMFPNPLSLLKCVICFVIWSTFAFCDTACYDKAGQISTFRTFALKTWVSFNAGTGVLVWINWIIYRNRYWFVPEELRIKKTTLTAGAAQTNYGSQSV